MVQAVGATSPNLSQLAQILKHIPLISAQYQQALASVNAALETQQQALDMFVQALGVGENVDVEA